MRKLIILLTLIIAFSSCKKGGKGDKGTPKEPEEVLAPVKSSLLTPARDEACIEGTVVSNTENKISFTWTASANTDTYEIVIKNLSTNAIINRTSNTNSVEVNLSRNTPYSWHVISKSNKIASTAQSDIWKFYNAGVGVTNYAPFPTEILSPLMGQTIDAVNGKITLRWKGSDVDNDVLNYDIYFGTQQNPTLLKTNVVTESDNDIAVNTQTVYYWRVVTRDAKGNTSDSGVFQFKVN
jgi:hypothetical protein